MRSLPRLLVPLAVVAPLLACATAPGDGGSQESNIEGGEIEEGTPAVGLLTLSNGAYCTGTLIAPSVVLTAGHCASVDAIAFVTGTGRPGIAMVEHPADGRVMHPSYDPDVDMGDCPHRWTANDVGLVHLKTPITDIAPLPFAKLAPARGDTCRLIGYGRHTEATTKTDRQKRAADETVQSIGVAHIQTTFKTGISNHGDSGGPLFCWGEIAAVVSCGEEGDLVTEYMASVVAAGPWIEDVIEDWTDHPPPDGPIWGEGVTTLLAHERGAGPGDAPKVEGSECAPGEATFTLDLPRKSVVAETCEGVWGEKHHPTKREVPLGDRDLARLDSVTKTIKIMPAGYRNCGAAVRFRQIEVTSAAGTRRYRDESFACSTSPGFANNLGELTRVLREITAR